jgi:sugar transferase (PEP-CTERM system associated)
LIECDVVAIGCRAFHIIFGVRKTLAVGNDRGAATKLRFGAGIYGRMRIRLFGHHWYLPLALLWVTETVAAVESYLLSAHLLFGEVADRVSVLPSIIFGFFVILGMVAMGMFSRRQRIRMPGLVVRITVCTVAGGAMALPFLAYWHDDLHVSMKAVGIAIPMCWVLLFLIRHNAETFIDDQKFKRRVLVLGVGSNAHILVQLRRRADRRAINLLGYVAVNGEPRLVSEDRVIPMTVPLSTYARENHVAEIVVALDDRRHNFPQRELLNCRLAGIEVTELATFLERETGKLYVELLNPSWMIFNGGFRAGLVRQIGERVFDVVMSSAFLVATMPIMLLTVLAIKLEDGLWAPAIYSQERVGLMGRSIKLYKFRSMCADAEGDGRPRWAQPGDARVTRVGSLIRKIRIDELPQLVNVLKGDMSFVGPRPERPAFVEELADRIPYYNERHRVKPGITGWAQLCYPYGSCERDAREKLHYDLFYVKNRGLAFTLLILLQTVEVILLGKGAR